MHRIDIPGGGWVELRDPAEMTMRHKKVIRSAGLAALAALKKAESKLPKDLPTDLKERLAIVSKLDMTELGLNFDEAESFQTMQSRSQPWIRCGTWTRRDTTFSPRPLRI
jgi:hypothetical protein